MSTEEARLGDIAKLINGGAWTQDKYADQGVPVVRVSDMKAGSVETSNLKYLDQRHYDRYKKHKLQKNDLVIATVGSHKTSASAAGRATVMPSFVRGMFLNQNAVCIRSASDQLDQKYLGYLGQSPDFQHYVQTMGKGAANQVRIALSAIKDYEFDLPSLQQQQRVAEILSAYDDLIETNQRRIARLEEAARLLYREWFVHLRFPGHEHTPATDGVPEGWEKKSAFDVMEVMSGGTPRTKVQEYWGGDIPFFTPKDATNTPYAFETERTLTKRGLDNCSSNLYTKETLFITARGTVGKVFFAQAPMAMNQSCYALRAYEPLNQHFLYCALRAAVERFKAQATGSVFDAIIMDTFKQIPFVVPETGLVDLFTEKAKPLFQQIDRLLLQNAKLKEARDLLLPRLMSGDIAV